MSQSILTTTQRVPMNKIEQLNAALTELAKIEIKAGQALVMADVIIKLQKLGQEILDESTKDESTKEDQP